MVDTRKIKCYYEIVPNPTAQKLGKLLDFPWTRFFDDSEPEEKATGSEVMRNRFDSGTTKSTVTLEQLRTLSDAISTSVRAFYCLASALGMSKAELLTGKPSAPENETNEITYDKRIFANNLNWFITQTGEKQTDIAALLGVSKSTVSDYCRGKQMPRMDKIELLAIHFGIRKSDLLEKTVSDTPCKQLRAMRKALSLCAGEFYNLASALGVSTAELLGEGSDSPAKEEPSSAAEARQSEGTEEAARPGGEVTITIRGSAEALEPLAALLALTGKVRE